MIRGPLCQKFNRGDKVYTGSDTFDKGRVYTIKAYATIRNFDDGTNNLAYGYILDDPKYPLYVVNDDNLTPYKSYQLPEELFILT